MQGAPDSEQVGAERRCPSCGAASDESARYCPSCGRALVGRAAGTDIGNWVSAGWALFLRDIPIAIAIPLIVVIPAVGFFILGYFGFFTLAIVAEEASGAPYIVPIVLGALLGAEAVFLFLVIPALQGGIYACFLQGIRTGKLTADNLWAGFRRWWACTWVSALLGGAAVLCLPLMFILIGLPLLLGLLTLHWLSLFRIVDKGGGGIEALSFACRAFRGRPWIMLVYTLLMFILMNAGVAAMYFGVLVTIPIADAAFAATYDSLSKEQEPAPVP
ncbi:MAG: zinc ribbon domain-containing protein [Armatimonadota bacterium]|nr:MAG: zinc ribbon domain-containing protein [Armatimonadota bacterium]